MTEPKPSEEEMGRGALKDVVAVIEKLTPFCANFDEMIKMCQHGLENDAQLRLILSLLKAKK